MKTRARLLWLLVVASAGLAMAVYDAGGQPEKGTMQGTHRASRNQAGTALVQRPSGRPAQRLELEQLQVLRAQPPALELFGAKSWYVAPPPSPSPPPPPPSPPAAPAEPGAPPLPFAFMGKMVEEDRLTVFLVKEDRVFMASEGDVIDGTYKLEKIEAEQLTLRYLPLETVQTLAVSEVR